MADQHWTAGLFLEQSRSHIRVHSSTEERHAIGGIEGLSPLARGRPWIHIPLEVNSYLIERQLRKRLLNGGGKWLPILGRTARNVELDSSGPLKLSASLTYTVSGE